MGYKHEFEINEEKVADFLATAADKVRTVEDVDVLADLNKLFKKNVPLTLRKYVIAYMLKDSLKHYRFYGNKRGGMNDRNERNNRNRNEGKNNRKERNNEFTAQADDVAATETEERPHHPRVEIAPEDATSIFISIGKNRRVYPRDLVGILIAIAGIDRERIGDIKVLANYSFVQLYTEDAKIAIDKLNGYEYRGRKLAVSYSRQKSDAEKTETEPAADSASTAATTGFGTDTVTDAQMAAEDAAAYAAAEKAAADKEPFGL